jgi:hypothetical protein
VTAQIAVRPTTAITGVSVAPGTLTGPGGATIPAAEIIVRREYLHPNVILLGDAEVEPAPGGGTQYYVDLRITAVNSNDGNNNWAGGNLAAGRVVSASSSSEFSAEGWLRSNLTDGSRQSRLWNTMGWTSDSVAAGSTQYAGVQFPGDHGSLCASPRDRAPSRW